MEAVRLNRSLSSAQDLQSLLSICRSNLPEFDNVNRVTALHRLARLGGRGDMQERLLLELSERLQELKVQQLANTVWSMARLSLAPERILADLASRAMADIQEFGAQECSNFFWACGRIPWRHGQLLSMLASRCADISSELLPQHLGNIAWSMAKLKYVDQQLLEALAHKAMSTIPESEQQEISNLVWGFAKVSAKHEPLLEVVARCPIEGQGFTAQGLSNMAWCCATM